MNVGRDEADRAPLHSGIESHIAEQRADLLQCRRDLRCQSLGLGCQRERACLANEKRIVEQMAQAPERAAHRRLAQPDILSRLGYIAPAQQGIEDRQQVEVDAREMRFCHKEYIQYACDA